MKEKIGKKEYKSKIFQFNKFLRNNLTNKKFKALSGRCILTSKCGNKRYCAISVSEDFENSIFDNIRNTLNGNFNVVGLKDDVRCYFDNKPDSYITYAQIKKWVETKLKNAIQSKIEKIDFAKRRLCSCCERKVLAEIEGVNFKDIVFYIKLYPCNNCCIQINSYKPKIKVKHYKSYHDKNSKRIKQLALKIYKDISFIK